MKLSKGKIRQVWLSDRKKDLKHIIILIMITILVFVACLTTIYYGYKIKPSRFLFPYIDKSLIIAFGAGVGLAVSGAIFQILYHNPMASPNMIGATAGVKLGNVLIVFFYSYQAINLVTLRYKICYGLAIVCVLVVLLLGKLSRNKKENISVVETVMAGSIVSQFLNIFTMYQMYTMSDEEMLIYQEITMGINIDTSFLSIVLFFIILMIGIIPIFLLKYRFNIMSIDSYEAQSIGVKSWPIRIIGQCCGVLMSVAAIVHCGDVGMISMLVPYIVRSYVGADFRKVLIYSVCIGGSLVMIGRVFTLLVTIFGEAVPMSFILNLVLMPIFILILLKRKEDY